MNNLLSVLPGAASYTLLFNVLQFPAGVVPVSTVNAEDEEELKHYKGVYQDQWDKLFKQVRHSDVTYTTVVPYSTCKNLQCEAVVLQLVSRWRQETLVVL